MRLQERQSLFWAIPADDKYICLLTGTLSTIITVSSILYSLDFYF